MNRKTIAASERSTVGAPAPSIGEEAEARRVIYNRLVRQAKLVSLVLEHVDFKISPEALGVNKAFIKRELGVQTKVMSSGISDGLCIANIVWKVDFKLKRKRVVKCSASYIISYEGIKDCSEDIVEVFVDNVGRVASYAYFRALYANLDWSAGLNSQPLPIIQFQPKL